MKKLLLAVMLLLGAAGLAHADQPVPARWFRLSSSFGANPCPAGQACLWRKTDHTMHFVDDTGSDYVLGPGGIQSLLQNGSLTTQRFSLNIITPAIACADNSGAARTDCTIATGASFYALAYGVKCDGSTNDHSALQNAINAAQSAGGTLVLPRGVCVTNSALSLSSTGFRIVGDGMNNSIIRAGATMTGVLVFADASQNEFFHFADFTIDGNSDAGYGIVSAKIDHSSLERVRIIQTETAALSWGSGGVGSGYDNDIRYCEFYSNNGDGIRLTGSDSGNNIANIFQTKIFLNSGIGIWSTGGAGLNVEHSTIERNLVAGIYLQLLTQSGRITGNYFERNGTTGYAMTAPTSKTIKADIVINGSSTATTMNYSYPCSGIEISGNNSLQGSATSGFIYLLAANGIRVENNTLLDANRALIGTTAQGAGAAQVTGLNLRSNKLFAGGTYWNIEDATTSSVSTFTTADWSLDSAPKKNYFSQVPQDNSVQIISNSNPVTWGLSGTVYNGDVVAQIPATAGATDTMGQALNLTNFPELAGQTVYFAAWVKVDSTSAGVALYATGPGANSSSVLGDTNWHFVQTTAVLPSSGTVYFGFQKIGSASSAAYVARPVLAVLGAPYAGFTSTPTTKEIANNLTAYGAVSAQGVAATSGATLVNGQAVQSTGSYYSGGAAHGYSAGFVASPTSTSPGGQLMFQVNGANEWVINSNGVLKPVTSGNVFSTYYSAQSQSVTGTTTTTIAPTSGGTVYLNLASATNVTSLTVTASGCTDGEFVTIHIIQPSTGTAATVPTTWTGVSFAGGTFSNTATLSKRDTVTLQCVSANSKWYELSRSLNLAN